MRKIRLQNLKTGREYTVDDQAWAVLRAKGFASRFTVVEEIEVKPASVKVSYMPSEIEQLLGLAKAEEKKVQPPAASSRGQQRDHAQDG